MESSKKRLFALLALPLFLFGCSLLQRARIQQEVTIDTHVEEKADFSQRNTMMIFTLAHEEKTLSKTTLTANEATSDILSLELLNHGFRVIDRAVINDYLDESKIELGSTDLTHILEMGRNLQSDFLVLTNLFENLQSSHAITFLPGKILTSIDTSANIGLNARIIDLETGEVVWVGIATTQDQNFQKAIHRISRKLIASFIDRAGR